MFKVTLIVFCCIMIPLNTVVCEYFFPGIEENNVIHWWWLRLDIVCLTWVASAYAYKLKHDIKLDRIINLLTSIWIGLSLTDFTERWVLKENEPFSLFDAFGIFITLFLSILVEFKNEIKDLLNNKLKWHKYLGN